MEKVVKEKYPGVRIMAGPGSQQTETAPFPLFKENWVWDGSLCIIEKEETFM